MDGSRLLTLCLSQKEKVNTPKCTIQLLEVAVTDKKLSLRLNDSCKRVPLTIKGGSGIKLFRTGQWGRVFICVEPLFQQYIYHVSLKSWGLCCDIPSLVCKIYLLCQDSGSSCSSSPFAFQMYMFLGFTIDSGYWGRVEKTGKHAADAEHGTLGIILISQG